jgi:hypothetical protein
MITLPTSWIYPGKVNRTLVRLQEFKRDSLFHSFLTCVYPVYQSKHNLNDKQLYINRFKISLFEYRKNYKTDDYDKILQNLSKDFEINIYLLHCAKTDTLIKNSYIHSDDAPVIMIELCDIFYPVGVNDKHGIHTMFFEGYDNEFRRSLEAFDKSGISEDFENEPEDEITFDMKHIFVYDVSKSLKHYKLK